ncbi:hypothetical protein EVG20_g8349 [Dentipellis fragilis]|uniref:Uncharacterized protein n=1 Tax=Dentipellis fragilis TaxID=205917 RepID=A0A4Y9Y798_9AGAM|nr:hypothetical protein EVG20_g8349 [Dentipellis fragilis]
MDLLPLQTDAIRVAERGSLFATALPTQEHRFVRRVPPLHCSLALKAAVDGAPFQMEEVARRGVYVHRLAKESPESRDVRPIRCIREATNAYAYADALFLPVNNVSILSPRRKRPLKLLLT